MRRVQPMDSDGETSACRQTSTHAAHYLICDFRTRSSRDFHTKLSASLERQAHGNKAIGRAANEFQKVFGRIGEKDHECDVTRREIKMTDRQANQAAFRQLKGIIQKTYPPGPSQFQG